VCYTSLRAFEKRLDLQCSWEFLETLPSTLRFVEWSAFNIEAPRRRVSLALISFVVIQPYVVGHTLVMLLFSSFATS
jgi:hypothetical protein